MSRMIALMSAFAGIVIVAFSQDAMTNESIVKMVKAGLSERVIVESVYQRSGTYALSPDDLISLKTAGVSDEIVAAMQAKMKPQEAPPTNLAPPASQLAPASLTAASPAVTTPVRRTRVLTR